MAVVEKSRIETEAEILVLESWGIVAGKLVNWMDEEQLNTKIDEIRCAMMSDILGEIIRTNSIEGFCFLRNNGAK